MAVGCLLTVKYIVHHRTQINLRRHLLVQERFDIGHEDQQLAPEQVDLLCLVSAAVGLLLHLRQRLIPPIASTHQSF